MFAITVRSSRRTLLAAALAGSALSRLHARAIGTPIASAWEPVAELELPRSEYAATVLDGAIYVAGGFGTESSFDRFHPADNAWERIADLPEPRHHLALLALDGAIYLAGGLNAAQNSAEANFWRYDPASDRWESLEPLPQGARGSLGGGVIDGMLYVVGGSSHDLSGPATADLAAWDPSSGTWELRAPMPTPREHLGVGVAGGMLVAVGGREGSHEEPGILEATERYDPATDRWDTGTPMPTPRAGLGVASDGDAIYVVGGERFLGTPETIGAVERYSPADDRWEQLPDLPIARHGVAAALVDGSLYAIGGSIAAGRIDNVRMVDRIDIRRP
jgi:N-acetylneuraminic acid mutarotase